MASVVSDSFQPCRLQATRLFCPRDSPGKNTGMGYHFLFWGIFPTQGLNLSHLHVLRWTWLAISSSRGSSQLRIEPRSPTLQVDSLPAERSPRTLEWVAIPFSSGSSQPRNLTGVSCITGGFFTSWATGEVRTWLDSQTNCELSSRVGHRAQSVLGMQKQSHRGHLFSKPPADGASSTYFTLD